MAVTLSPPQEYKRGKSSLAWLPVGNRMVVTLVHPYRWFIWSGRKMDNLQRMNEVDSVTSNAYKRMQYSLACLLSLKDIKLGCRRLFTYMARFSSSTKIIQCPLLSFFPFFFVIILSLYAWSLFVERSFMHFFTHLFPSIAFCASASISKLYYTLFQGGCFYTNLAWWIRLFLSKWWNLSHHISLADLIHVGYHDTDEKIQVILYL